MNTIIDTDALLGITLPTDVHHKNAKQLLQRLVERRAQILILPTTLCEFSLTATSRIGMVKTKEIIGNFMSKNYIIIPLSDNLIQDAYQFYSHQTSKEESLFDCYIMAVTKQLHIDCIFSFDKGYTKNGFLLAEDFIRTHDSTTL